LNTLVSSRSAPPGVAGQFSAGVNTSSSLTVLAMVMLDMYHLPERKSARSSRWSLRTDSSQPSGSSETMKGGSLSGAVCRITGGSVGPSLVAFQRHSNPSWDSLPMGNPCRATRRSNAASFLAATAVERCSRNSSAPSPSRYRSLSRASAQAASPAALGSPYSWMRRAAIAQLTRGPCAPQERPVK
jgi:hypothetical protein